VLAVKLWPPGVFLHKQLPRGGNFGKISITKLTICVIIAEVLLFTCDNLYKQYYVLLLTFLMETSVGQRY
jgi:hypothetical protein